MKGDLSDDPIGQALSDRVACLGGYGSICTEAEARKKGLTVPKPIKLLVKGPAEIKLIEVQMKDPQKPTEKPPVEAKPAQQQRGVPSTQESSASNIKVSLEDDPIGYCLAIRTQAGGFSAVISEADAKKKGFEQPRRFKLLPKGKEEQDLVSA